jgi:hypothetical protein
MINLAAALALSTASLGLSAASLQAATTSPPPTEATVRSGAKDFDFEFGTWATRVRVLRNPLSGQKPIWAEYKGTSIVRPLLQGRANTVELSVAGPSGSIEGVSLRLYNAQTRQWSLNFASLRNGALTAPVYGSFDGRGRGLFFGQDMLEGRAVLVRFIITQVSRTEARFEQSYSADGGATWEANWLAVDRLL